MTRSLIGPGSMALLACWTLLAACHQDGSETRTLDSDLPQYQKVAAQLQPECARPSQSVTYTSPLLSSNQDEHFAWVHGRITRTFQPEKPQAECDLGTYYQSASFYTGAEILVEDQQGQLVFSELIETETPQSAYVVYEPVLFWGKQDRFLLIEETVVYGQEGVRGYLGVDLKQQTIKPLPLCSNGHFGPTFVATLATDQALFLCEWGLQHPYFETWDPIKDQVTAYLPPAVQQNVALPQIYP